MEFAPKVSIGIPVFNGADYLREAVDSALAQTYRNIEVLVVNDGSSDSGATEQIARGYGDRIRYFVKPNGGVASALNRAIQEMTGEYFSWLSHDDLYTPDKVEREVLSLSGPERDRIVVYSDYAVFSTDPTSVVPVRMAGVPPEQFRYWITIENSLHGCTLLIPRSAFVECGRFDETLRTTQDYDLWFRMARRYRFVHVPEVLVKARSHPDQGSLRMADTALAECNALLSGFVEGLTPSELAQATTLAPSLAYAEIATGMLRRGFRGAAGAAARLSLRALPRGSAGDAAQALRLLVDGYAPSLRGGFGLSAFLETLRRKAGGGVRRVGKLLGAQRPARSGERNLQEKFSEIYEKNIFGGRVSRSGEGSDLVQTAAIRRELPRVIRQLGVKTFLDAPCGDWCWMQHTDLGVDQYIGVDIVKALIERNESEFGSPCIAFECLDLATGDLPRADLIFSRDCLVHLSFADALRIIANFKRSGAEYLLTTTFPARESNNDLVGKDSFWRPLNLELPPFNFPPPIELINEGCTEEAGEYADKSLGLWRLRDIAC